MLQYILFAFFPFFFLLFAKGKKKLYNSNNYNNFCKKFFFSEYKIRDQKEKKKVFSDIKLILIFIVVLEVI